MKKKQYVSPRVQNLDNMSGASLACDAPGSSAEFTCVNGSDAVGDCYNEGNTAGDYCDSSGNSPLRP